MKTRSTVSTASLPTRGSARVAIQPAVPQPIAVFPTMPASRALALPLVFVAAVASFVALPSAGRNQHLAWTFLGAAGALAVWDLVLLGASRASRRLLTIEVVIRRPHWIQACVQGTLLLYWGWYWREVYNSLPFIFAQLLFAYAFDMLLSWSRRDTYTLGFGPFPVILSINFFLWFRPDWFYLQFAMVALGLAAKELIRWDKDGRCVHIFNPSSFPLAVFSVVLLATGTTHITWGNDIATTLFYPPHIYLVMFALGLVGQYFFGVTTMTMSAVVTMYVFGLAYYAATGVYFFLDAYIPIAVFLGMHFLFTDPATAPRTELGRIVFGVLYAAGVTILYGILERYGAPSFYDKLLPIPILNVMIQAIDRVAQSKALAWFDPARMGRALAPRRRHLAYIGVWTVMFSVISAAHGVGDTVPGHWLPFWEQACREGRHNACPTLAMFLDQYCDEGSGWACNEMGVLFGGARSSPAFDRRMFARACANGFASGCDNGRRVTEGIGSPRRADPLIADYRIVLREGKGPLPPISAPALYERACSQGWETACGEAAAGTAASR